MNLPYSHKHHLEAHKWSNIFYGKFLPTQNLPFTPSPSIVTLNFFLQREKTTLHDFPLFLSFSVIHLIPSYGKREV